MKLIFAAALLLTACAGLGTEPQGEAPSMDMVQENSKSFKAPGDHTPDEIYEKLQQIAQESYKKQPRPTQGKQFSVSLPSEKPAGDEKKEWIWNTVQVFYRDSKSVDQISLETQNCNVAVDKLDQAALKKRTQSLVMLVSQTLFGMPFQLSDKYFEEAKDWNSPVRIPIRQEYLPVVDMRMIRNSTKCDGFVGYGYRYDFFMR